jgi:hypothetical protein
MTHAQSWGWLSAALLLLNISAEVLFLKLVFRRQDPLSRLLRLYAACLLLFDLCGLIVALCSSGWLYWHVYWWAAIASNVLLCLVAVQVTAQVLDSRRRFAVAWCSGALVALAVAHVRGLPSGVTAQMLDLSLTADYVAGLILAVLLWFSGLEWPQGCLWATAGVAVMIGGNVVCSLRWLDGYPAAALYGLPLASLVSMVVFAFGIAPEPRREEALRMAA